MPAAFCFALAGLAFLRFGRRPTAYARRDDFPALYRLANAVAAALHAPAVDYIVLTPDYNASFARVGLRNSSVLSLGIPLLLSLDGQERVALLAHEIAHDVNGDPQHTFLMATALRTLERWHSVLRPDARQRRPQGELALAHILAQCVGWVLAALTHGWAMLLVHAVWQQSQRAECYADALAADVGGTQGMLGLLDKLHYAHVLQSAAHAALYNPGLDACHECARRIDEMSVREPERLRRVARLEGSQLDSTHPPTP